MTTTTRLRRPPAGLQLQGWPAQHSAATPPSEDEAIRATAVVGEIHRRVRRYGSRSRTHVSSGALLLGSGQLRARNHAGSGGALEHFLLEPLESVGN